MASNNNVFQAQFPKLNGGNYHQWSIQMKVFFESQDLWNLVEDGLQEPNNPTALTSKQNAELKEDRKKDRKALFFIYQAVDEAIFERISTSLTSKDAWDMLYKTYRGEDKVKMVRLQTLRCEFDGLRMRESESVEDFYNRVITLTDQMRINGEEIEDKRIVEKILRSLTRKFEYVVVAIEESKDLALLSLESMLGTLKSHELRMRNFDDAPSERAFLSSTKAKGKEHVRSLSETQCYYCHKYGHTMKYCKKRKEDESEDANFIYGNETQEGDTMFMAIEELETLVDGAWYKDDDDFVMNVPMDDTLPGNIKVDDE